MERFDAMAAKVKNAPVSDALADLSKQCQELHEIVLALGVHLQPVMSEPQRPPGINATEKVREVCSPVVMELRDRSNSVELDIRVLRDILSRLEV